MNSYAVRSNLMLFVSLAMLLASAAPIILCGRTHAPPIHPPFPSHAPARVQVSSPAGPLSVSELTGSGSNGVSAEIEARRARSAGTPGRLK